MSGVSQFTLVTSNQASTYGGGVTQAAFVSPSAGNQVHGSVFYLNVNSLTNANTWYQNAVGLKDEYKSNQGGATVGGPLVKNKLFGYLAYEQRRERDTIGEGALVRIPASPARVGYVLGPGQLQFLDSFIPGLTNPVVQNYLQKIPAPNVGPVFPFTPPQFCFPGNPSSCRPLTFGFYQHAEAQQATSDNATARLDYVASERNTFVASYLWDRDNADLSPSLYGTRFTGAQDARAQLVSGSWRFMSGSRFTNELRFAANLAPVDFVDRDQQGLPYVLNLGPLLNFFNPVFYQFSLFDLAPHSGYTYQDQGRTLKTYATQDNVSYVRGAHTARFGFQAQLIRVASYLQLPTVVYLGADGSGSLVDTLTVLAGGYYAIHSYPFPLNSSGTLVPGTAKSYPNLENYALYAQV